MYTYQRNLCYVGGINKPPYKPLISTQIVFKLKFKKKYDYNLQNKSAVFKKKIFLL